MYPDAFRLMLHRDALKDNHHLATFSFCLTRLVEGLRTWKHSKYFLKWVRASDITILIFAHDNLVCEVNKECFQENHLFRKKNDKLH